MADNYSLNSKFGLNVSSTGAKLKEQAQNVGASLSETVGNLFESMTDFVTKNENVYNGNVEYEIGVASRQAMIIGMNLRAADTKHRLDMTI
jgi:hypothetical protein